jgi:hypothetical protein
MANYIPTLLGLEEYTGKYSPNIDRELANKFVDTDAVQLGSYLNYFLVMSVSCNIRVISG